jgi:AraC-like DNA-binding protein
MVFGEVGLASGTWFSWHRHEQHQLVWASRGVVNVDVGEAHWVLPPSRALWVPAGTTHRTGTPSGADIRAIYLRPALSPLRWDAPALVRVTDLLRELFDYLTVAELDDAQRSRGEAVVFDLLEPVEVVPLGARMPTDDRAHRVAATLVVDPSDLRTLAEHGTVVGASSRTLARLFVAETGLGFGQWRTQIRLAASLPLLADGMGLTGVSRRVGYASPSAFVAAFHREVGLPPGRYFAN